MLLLQTLGQHAFVESYRNEIVVGTTFTGEYRPAVINEREDQRFRGSFIFGLDVIGNAAEFNICIKASYHGCGVSSGECGE
jgi:hypothetical protein